MAWNVALRGGAALLLALPVLAGCGTDLPARRADGLDRVFAPMPEPAPQLVLQVAPASQPLPRPVPPQGVAKDPMPAPAAIEPAAAAPPASIETAALPALPPAEARVDPALRRASLIRDNPWLTQFWSELGTSEQSRVTRAILRSGAVVGTGAVPATWDRMGLTDRVRLVFGEGG